MSKTEDFNISFNVLRHFIIKNVIIKQAFAEFIGTFFVVLMADSVNASLTLKNHKDIDNFAAAYCTGIGPMIAALVGAVISGAHVNPMVTIGFASVRKCPLKCVIIFIAVQYFGAFLASALVFANNYHNISAYDNGERSAYGKSISTGHIFTTFPGKYATITGVLIDQILCAGILQLCNMALNDRNNLKIPPALVPVSLLSIVCSLNVAFGLNCNAPLNPARDVSGRFFASIFGYGVDVWRPLNSYYWLIGGLIGPHIGGIIGSWIYYMAIELHHNNH